MICLADNDILLKLAACDLLSETLSLLGITQREVYVLPTARHKIRKDKKLSEKYGEGVSRALTSLDDVNELSLSPNSDEMNLLDGVRRPESGQHLIHPGEQILFASTSFFNDFLLATGDKVCLRALSQAPSCASLRACCLCGASHSLAHRNRRIRCRQNESGSEIFL